MTDRPSLSYRVVFAALGISLLLAAGVAFHIYKRYVHFEPVAAAHVPAGAAVAARLDIEQAVVYEPFRAHVLPLLELGATAPQSRLIRLERETTIELGVDLREVLFATTSAGEWLVLLGGHFRRTGVIAGVSRLLAAEGIETALWSGPERLVHSSGVTFAIAKDGVLVLGSSENLVLSALPARPPSLPFQPGAALEFFAQPAEGPQVLRSVHLRVLPGDVFPVTLEATTQDSTWSPTAAIALLSGQTRDFVLLGPDVELTLGELTRTRLTAQARADRSQFDATVGRLADDVARWFQ